MILSVATSVVFLFLTRKGHLLPRLRKAVLWTGWQKKSSSLYEGTEK